MKRKKPKRTWLCMFFAAPQEPCAQVLRAAAETVQNIYCRSPVSYDNNDGMSMRWHRSNAEDAMSYNTIVLSVPCYMFELDSFCDAVADALAAPDFCWVCERTRTVLDKYGYGESDPPEGPFTNLKSVYVRFFRYGYIREKYVWKAYMNDDTGCIEM